MEIEVSLRINCELQLSNPDKGSKSEETIANTSPEYWLVATCLLLRLK